MVNVISRFIHVSKPRALYMLFSRFKSIQGILRYYSNRQAKELLNGSKLALVTLNGVNPVNQGTHPDALISSTVMPGNVIMTVSGYPFNIARYEDQYVLSSKDGKQFENILRDRAIAYYGGNGNSHYSDGDIIEHDGKIYLFYRMCYNDCDEPHVTIFQRSTNDLRNWSEEKSVVTGYRKDGIKYISPAIVADKHHFSMYYVEMDNDNEYRLKVRQSDTLDFQKYKEEQITIMNTPEGKNIWHIDVVRANEKYYGLFVYAQGYGGHEARLYEAVSEDGLKWCIGERIALDIDPKHINRIYRSTMVYKNGKWDLYIPVRNNKMCWFVLLYKEYVFSFDNE